MVGHQRTTNSNGGGDRNRFVFAYYVTGHGFGHATRVVAVVQHLIAAGHDVHVVTGAPDFVFTSEIESPNLHIRKDVLDCGAVQADALTVDRLASLEKYHETAVVPRAIILETEVQWLNSIKADLVVSDVVPVACRAAADAGIRSVCVTNFSWDFIYAEYVMEAGNHHRSVVWQIAEDYSHCEFLLRLPGYCPMPAFREVIDVPLVVRRLHKFRNTDSGACLNSIDTCSQVGSLLWNNNERELLTTDSVEIPFSGQDGGDGWAYFKSSLHGSKAGWMYCCFSWSDDEGHTSFSHQGYIERIREEVKASNSDLDRSSNRLVALDSSHETGIKCEELQRTSSEDYEEDVDTPSIDHAEGSDQVKKKHEQRFPVLREPAGVLC